MIISRGCDIKFVQARLRVVVCIFLILAFLSPNFDHHEDETNHETCLICILFESLSGLFIFDPPSLIKPTLLGFSTLGLTAKVPAPEKGGDGFKAVSLEEAKKLYENGATMIACHSHTTDFMKGHPSGTIHITYIY